MKYTFAPHLLLRSPVGQPQAYTNDLQAFLANPFFRTALYLATPSFYDQLKRVDFRQTNLSKKGRLTLQKYVNRYCFRPTPFGMFASVALTSWNGHALFNAFKLYQPHITMDMYFQNLLYTDAIRRSSGDKGDYERNPTLYRVLNEYRFVRTGLDETGAQRDFQLQSIGFSKLLMGLIDFCSRAKSRQQINEHIMQAASCTIAEATDYCGFLIDAQFLLNTQRINITGKDYFQSHQCDTQLPDLWKSPPDLWVRQLEGIASKIRENYPGTDQYKGLYNVILRREATDEGLGKPEQSALSTGLDGLATLVAYEPPAAMAEFARSFQQHFEGRAIPLLKALDPEAGIGYQQDLPERNNVLLETLQIPYQKSANEHRQWTKLHSFFMQTWLKHPTNAKVLKLSAKDLEPLKKAGDSEQLLGISVLFRKAGDQLFIENAGGINAPALMGRFTTADTSIHEAAKAMAQELENQNPKLIFAELLQLADPHTDNVNRRESIYHFEIPITAVSTLPHERQLALTDLLVSVDNGKVILYSEKHQKLVVPRLTSAYNHQLNKLPLFRFLADLSYQYGRHNFSFDLRALFPNLSFYPRIEYEGVILHLATWVLSMERLSAIQRMEEKQAITAFHKLCKDIALPARFSFTEGDQELVFNQERDWEILFFLACIRQSKNIVLKEYLHQGEVRQYNAYVLPSTPISLPSPGQIIQSPRSKKVTRKFIPGSQWLYLKIYMPRIAANHLLIRLLPVIRKPYRNGRITQWFFIRYEDHAPHIRLRLKVSPEAVSEILVAFKEKLEDRIQQQVIREYQIDVYSRELERYAIGGIAETERFFWASSELVIAFLKNKSPYSTHEFALCSVSLIINSIIGDIDAQIHFVLHSYQQFLPEFTEQPFRIELDKKYRELSPGINRAFQDSAPALLSGSLKAALNFKKSLMALRPNLATESFATYNYLQSIIHMHFNRIFTDESRKQEMISYYLLYKYYTGIKGRSKKYQSAIRSDEVLIH